MISQIPFSTYDRFQITFGGNRSVVYDLGTGKVFHLNDAATRILQGILEDDANHLYTLSAEFLSELQAIGIIAEDGKLNKELIGVGPIPAKPLKKTWIELTNQCNQQCVHCYASSSPISDYGLDTNKIVSFLNDVIRIGCEAVQFTGGEPLLRKDLPLFCEIAKQGGLKEIEVFSNLSTNNKKILSAIAKSSVIVSTTILAPDAGTHDRLTRSPGSFSRMVSNVQYLQSLGVHVNASIILTAETEDRLEDIVELCNQLELRFGEPDPVRPFGRGTDENIKCKKLHNVRMEPYFETTPRSFLYAKHFNSCWGNMLFLRYDGKVTPCPHAREFVFGSVEIDGIESIIENALSKAWTLTMDKVETCSECEFRFLCTDCRPLAYEGNDTGLYMKNKRCLYDPYTGKWKQN